MKKSFKYRLYPNREQREALFAQFNFSCMLRNSALQERRSFYSKFGKGLSYKQQAAELPEIRRSFTEAQNIYSQVLQQVLKQIDAAFVNFFRRVKNGEKPGYPRYKKRRQFNSLCFPQVHDQLTGVGGVKRLPNDRLQIFGIPGEVKVKWHRPFLGRCKQARIVKNASGQFFLSLSCEDVPAEKLEKTGKTIGIDLGLNSFITANDGTEFHHSRAHLTAKEKLAAKQRRLALKQKNSRNTRRLRNEIAKAHQRIVNVRSDFQHKLSKQLVAENDLICIEDLDIKGMIEQERKQKEGEPFRPFPNNFNIMDAAWGNFVLLLKYKAESAGKTVVAVNPKNTSKMCSNCGEVKKDLSLAARIYHCQACGLTMPRDVNAALNIKRLGMSLAIDQKIDFRSPSQIPIWEG